MLMNTWQRGTKMSAVELLHNALQTPDGTIITSRHRHDYVVHKDANGKTYFIDGGLDYVRCSANGDEHHLSVWSDDDHEVIRERAEWGTYGKNGDKELRWVAIKDMETDHLKAAIRYCYATKASKLKSKMRQTFVTELEYRNA